MNRRNKRWGGWVSVVVLVVVLAASFLFGWWQPEPLYQDQPVSYWISQLASQTSGWQGPVFDGSAMKAFSRTDREAIPFLMATLKARSGWADFVPERFWGVLPWKLGARSRFQRLAADQARFMAVASLSQMGASAREAVPIVIDVLTDRQAHMRWQAAGALGNIGRAARQAVPALIRSSKDAEFTMRLATLSALKKIAPEEERVLSAFTAALGDRRKEVQFLAAEQLLEKGPRTRAWLDTVVGLSRGPEASDRWAAIEILRKSGPAILDALPAMVERLNDDNNRVRALAAIVLGEVGPPARAAVPALTKALGDEYSNVREAANEALAKIGPYQLMPFGNSIHQGQNSNGWQGDAAGYSPGGAVDLSPGRQPWDRSSTTLIEAPEGRKRWRPH